MQATTADLLTVTSATSRRDKSERQWREAITSAVNEGNSLRAVAEAAGISRTRVHQIVKEMREGTFRA